MQVDACPFHSARLPLPKKLALLKTIQEGGLLNSYVEYAREFLRQRPVVTVAALTSQQSLRRGVPLNPWLTWKARLAGLDVSRAEFVPILEKNGKVTAAALVGRVQGPSKALVLMMGGNHLPAEEGLRLLARALLAPSSF